MNSFAALARPTGCAYGLQKVSNFDDYVQKVSINVALPASAMGLQDQ
jgi:hypothetical protein